MLSGDVGYIEISSFRNLIAYKIIELVRSTSVVAVLFLSKILAIDKKYSFNLDAIVSESEMHSLFNCSSSGTLRKHVRAIYSNMSRL